MAYIINRFSGSQLTVLEDGTIDVSTSLGLVGRNYTGYGEIQNENFLYLLENFSNISPPSRPLSGQTWFNTSNSTLNVYDGNDWKAVGSAVVSDSQPAGNEGALWIDSKTDQLYTYNNGWILVGPEAVENFGVTKIRARSIRDVSGVEHAILEMVNDNKTICVTSSDEFTINLTDLIDGFSSIKPGINLNSNTLSGNKIYHYVGDVIGNSESATRLANPRKINGINFDGQTDITITSNTNATLSRGTYLTGSNFNGASATTWAVDATPSNIIGKVVARDSAGDFSAGIITANLVGNVTGNVTATTGTSVFNVVQANSVIGATFTGNAFTATKLETARTINGIAFDATANITVPAAANTLTGTVLAANVVNSSLVSLGFLNNLAVKDTGITVGNNSVLKIFAESSSENPVVYSQVAGKSLFMQVQDSAYPGATAKISLSPSDVALLLGGSNTPAFMPGRDIDVNLGHVNYRWKDTYSQFFRGVATTAQYADLAEKYVADDDYEMGTVVEFGGEFEVTVATNETPTIAGVISQNPAYLMNSELTGKYTAIVALQGRVPCKVTGIVKKGDMLVSAGNGLAKAKSRPEIGTVIGKALEDFNGETGMIEAVVGRL
jgi:hypothetical protein